MSRYRIVARFEEGLEDECVILASGSRYMRTAAEAAMFQRPLEVELSVDWKHKKRVYWYLVGWLEARGLAVTNETGDGDVELLVARARTAPSVPPPSA